MNIEIPPKIKHLTADKPYTVDSIGMSGSAVFTFPDMVLKIEKQDDHFHQMIKVMEWLNGKLPIPRIICHEEADGKSFLLMSRIPGRMSCNEYYLDRPQELVSLLAKAIKMLWEVDISDCPRTRELDRELAEARIRVKNRLVDIENAEPDTFGKNGFQTPAHLLQWLEENRPSWEPVFSHGDFCLPNIFIENGNISGFIDLGDAGIGDKWRDISLCYRSLKHNFDGTFGGKIYRDFSPDILFNELEIKPDLEKLRYYILLDELF